VWLSEVDGGIVSNFRILQGNAGDEAQLRPALDDHLRLYGRAPGLLAADRNVHSKENERLAKELGVRKVCLPKEQARRVRCARSTSGKDGSSGRGGFGLG
jgi:transposase, IS5 family